MRAPAPDTTVPIKFERTPGLSGIALPRATVFEDIGNLQSSEIKLVIQDADRNDLMLAIKAADDTIKEVLLDGMDEEDRKQLQATLDTSGRTRLADAEGAQERIAQVVRTLNDQGKVRVIHGDAADQFI